MIVATAINIEKFYAMQCEKYVVSYVNVYVNVIFITERVCLLDYVTKLFKKWDYVTISSEIVI